MQLLKNVRIVRVFGTSGGVKKSTALYGRAVDMSGFDSCLFLCLGSSKQAGSSRAKMAIQGCSSTAGTFYSLNGANASCASGAHGTSSWSSGSKNGKILAVDIKPLSTQKFLRPMMIGTSTGDFGGVLAIQYNARLKGSTLLYFDSTAAGSTKWLADQVGGQTVVTGCTATANTTAV